MFRDIIKIHFRSANCIEVQKLPYSKEK